MMPRLIKRFDIRASVIYGVVATFWIIFSDTLAFFFFEHDLRLNAMVSIFKGLGFVIITTGVLFIILAAEMRKRRHIEQELQLERDISPVAIIVFDINGRISYANVQAEKILGKPRSEIVGQPFNAATWHVTDHNGNSIEGDYPGMLKMMQARQTIFGIQQAVEVVEGKRILLEINLAPIFNNTGVITGAVATFNDVTASRTQERRLRESEERFRLLFNNNPYPMWVFDFETLAFLEVNEAAIKHYGYSHDEFLALLITDIRPSAEIPKLLEDLQKSSSTLRNAGEWKHRLKSGQIIDVEIISYKIEYAGRQAVVVVAQDITQRKAAEKALRESEFSLKRAQTVAHLGDWSWDTETNSVLASDEIYHIFNVDRATFNGNLNEIIKVIHPDDSALIMQAIQAVIHEKKISSVEFRVIWPDGSVHEVWAEAGEVVTDAQGNILQLSGIVQDITQRKAAEKALRASEYSLKRAQAIAHVGDWTWDTRTDKVRWSDEMFCIFGVDHATFTGNLNEIIEAAIHPDDKAAVTQANNAVIHGQEPIALEYRVVWPDGSVHKVRAEAGEAISDVQGNILQLSGIVQDITEEKAAENALIESEARYRMLIEQASDAIFIIDNQDRYLEVNSAACKLLGYSREEILQMKIPDLVKITPNTPIRYEELQHGKTLIREREMICKDGTLVSVEFSSKMLLDGNLQTIGRDITERKRAEEELRLKSTALESAANGIAITDVKGVIQWVNPAFAALTGYSADEAVGHNPRELVKSGLHNPKFYEDMWSTILKGHVWRGEIVNRRKDGSFYTEEMTITPVRNEAGEISHFIAIKQDISERKLQQEAIQKLNAELEERVVERTTQLNHIKNRIESILNSTADSIVYIHINGSIEQVNPAFTQIFGYQPDEILLQPFSELVIPQDIDRLEQVFASVLTNRQAQHADVTAYCRDGKTFDAAVLLSPVIENGNKMVGIVASVHDITNRNYMLRHAMDLSEIKSRYVSMAAHDLRNPMAVILTASETLEHYYDKLNAEKKLAKYEQIRANIKIMTDILDDVLIMGQVESGKLEFRPALMDINTFCQNMIAEMVQAAKTSIHVEFSAYGIEQSVTMDAKLLRHILGNLLSNAIKYSPADSTVIFTASEQSEQITFRIQDQGIGIPEAEQTQLFETFHRAHNARHIPGTGLGLAIVKQSVELHGGTIAFESEEGRGTTFIVNLPIVC